MSGTTFSSPAHAMNGLMRPPNGHKATLRSYEFQMPLHYPRFKKADYESMPEWQLDRLLTQYGLPVIGDINHKRKFAMGAFLWPSQNQ